MSDLEDSVNRSIVGLLWDERARLIAVVEEIEAEGIPDDAYYHYLSGMVHGIARAAIQISESQGVHCEATTSEYNIGHTDGYYIGVTEGERQERAAIVAWLSTGCAADWWMAPDFAEAIERGDHLGGDDE